MITFSANLGLLWNDRPLPEAIHAAATAGFDAVECHCPYDWPAADVRAALESTGLSMMSLNTRLGDAEGDLGVAAIPGREAVAVDYIDEAIAYASEIDCPNVHVVAGRTGRSGQSEMVYQSNLAYAADRAAAHGQTILIEAMNSGVTNYHLTRLDQGVATIDAVGARNLKLMVDCFHCTLMEDDLLATFARVVGHVGHVQFAAVPDRGEPVDGEVDYHTLLPAMAALGYDGPFGAEYFPRSTTDDGLAWLDAWHAERTTSTRITGE